MKTPAYRILDRIWEGTVFLISLGILLIGGYCTADSVWLLDHAQDRTLAAFRPAPEQKPEETASVSPDQIGWLTLAEAGVDLPLMQGEDNMKYINTDPYGEFSLSGSIFLDYRNAADFSDACSIIYGHHMQGGRMFGALDAYRDPDFVQAHPEGWLLTKTQRFRLHIFCVLEADATDSVLFQPSGRKAVLQRLRESPLFYEKPGAGRIVILSTCTGNTGTLRLLAAATLEEADE